MTETDTKSVVWQNVSALMKAKFGRENLTKLAKQAGFGPGTSTRLKERETSVGVDVIDKLAVLFKLEPWQLLVPGLDIEHPATLGTGGADWPLPMVSRERFLALSSEGRAFVQGHMQRVIEEQEAKMRAPATKGQASQKTMESIR